MPGPVETVEFDVGMGFLDFWDDFVEGTSVV